MKSKFLFTTVAAACFLSACGGGSPSNQGADTSATPERGALLQSPPFRVTSMTAADFTNSLNASATGKNLLAAAGTPKCGIDIQQLRYGTVGALSEKTTASGALMTPTGGPECTGARPIVLHAHGTNFNKSYNLANLADSGNPAYSEAVLIAAMYAAQGYIVIAPNYAGYDTSTLGYHPYLNADQESKDMMDSLDAGRKALSTLLNPVTDSGKLFITGYSQGGHVAMATHKAMQAAGKTVTASAPMSGPYAMSTFGDAIFTGNVNLGSPGLMALLATSYQKAYGNLYTKPTDLYESAYAAGVETLFPGTLDFTPAVAQGKLPASALFSSTPPTAPAGPAATAIQAQLDAWTTGSAISSNPLFQAGFGAGNLVTNSARLGYLMDVMANPSAATALNPIRQALWKNDLRSFAPTRPTLLCAGSGDPLVFYAPNTGLMAQTLAANPYVTTLDVASAVTSSTDMFASAKVGFSTLLKGIQDTSGTQSATLQYHGLVAPVCHGAARAYFQYVVAKNI